MIEWLARLLTPKATKSAKGDAPLAEMIRDAWARGLTDAEIAAETGAERAYVRSVRRRSSLAPNKGLLGGRWTAERRAKASATHKARWERDHDRLAAAVRPNVAKARAAKMNGATTH